MSPYRIQPSRPTPTPIVEYQSNYECTICGAKSVIEEHCTIPERAYLPYTTHMYMRCERNHRYIMCMPRAVKSLEVE